jgi:hypothetical protein
MTPKSKFLLEKFRNLSFTLVQPSGSASKLQSFWGDSSGRSKVSLALKIDCPTKDDLDCLVDSGCIRPAPSRKLDSSSTEPSSEAAENDGPAERARPSTCEYLLRFQARCLPSEESKTVAVEGVTIYSTTVNGQSLLFETEVVVRAASPPTTTNPGQANTKSPSITSKLELTAVLLQRSLVTTPLTATPSVFSLELGFGSPPSKTPSAVQGDKQAKLPPITFTLSLTRALDVSVECISGSSYGSTLVSLTMMHPNTHSEPVSITNIVLHPGHSRLKSKLLANRSMPGGEDTVTDMSRFVQWGYVPRTEPDLPLMLHPHESYSTVLTIDAGEDLRSRVLVSPITVTALVGSIGKEDQEYLRGRPSVVVSADAEWTTGRVAVEPADAFRVDMSLEKSSCFVGAPFIVSLRVLNLSTESKNLMLLMAKDDEKTTQKPGAVNTAVVSEVNGYTFGVWGLSGDDDGTARYVRDHELLAVDAALLLGEVKSQHSVDAELRFVPLREGTLNVPNLKLYDKTEGKWYSCFHKLRIVAGAKTD